MAYEQTYLNDRQVSNRFGVNRITVWRWLQNGNLPKPIKLSAGCTRWRLSDLERWENEKAEAAA